MKKRIYLLLLAVVAIFSSCKDDSGEFVEQLFTNAEITNALKECIIITVDSTANVLSIVDTANIGIGYSQYADSVYRLTLPPAANIIVDTLIVHGYGELLDSLEFNLNLAAEKSGNNIKRFWNTAIDNITFPNPHATLHEGNSAITNFVKNTCQMAFVSELVSSIYIEQLNALEVITTWNDLQFKYFEITGINAPVEIVVPVSQQMANGFFDHMAIVENAVRRDPKLRGNEGGSLFKVFATLKP